MLAQLLGASLVIAAAALLRVAARQTRPIRSGPWPGLTPHGARLLLLLASLLVGIQLLVGAPAQSAGAREPLPYLPLVTAGAVGVLALAARITRLPGALSAVCGVYLLAWSLPVLRWPELAPPPLLLPSAVLLDLVLWLRASDLTGLGAWVPRTARARRQATLTRAWRPRSEGPRNIERWRAASGGALFGLLLAVLEGPYAVILGAEARLWTGGALLVAGVLAAGCGAVAGLAATLTR